MEGTSFLQPARFYSLNFSLDRLLLRSIVKARISAFIREEVNPKTKGNCSSDRVFFSQHSRQGNNKVSSSLPHIK